jgi:S-disulfanyl-L-cysteine oxidoreductase SoxD
MPCRKKSNRLSGTGVLACLGGTGLLACLGFAQATRSVWDGVYSPEQAARGQVLYSNMCASCHGLALNGGESAPPLSGGEFLSNWNGLTVGDLFERIRVSMPADNPGHITRQQNADVIAHILNVNQFPPGKTELDTRTEVLKQIAVEMAKPEEKK